ncbi:MAG TPA: 2OG-Fe(II) oxygenase [Croceibacterium sp.]
MTGSAVAARPEHPDSELLRRIGQKVRKRLAANRAVHTIAHGGAELWAVSGFFDPVECGRLIALIDATARPSVAYALGGDEDVRTSFSGDLDPNDPFVRGLDRRIGSLLGLPYDTGEVLEGQRYTAGQQFKEHIDWFPPDSPGWQREKARGGQRAFTAMAYLNTVEAGGETDFPKLDLAIAPRQGTLLVWNNADPHGVPSPLTSHAGNPVVRGAKYVVTKWFRARPWR